jgi:tetraprenyl-beta-curcumene synthase
MAAPRTRDLAPRATWALALASARYWPSLAGAVRAQVRHWERRAAAMSDPELRALALAKLRAERFNAEAAALLATLAPRPQRAPAVDAIVALELMFDYLDGLTERPLADPLGDGQRLYAPFLGALDGEAAAGGDYSHELARSAQAALRRLPAWEAVAPVARRCALRGAHSQIRMHAAPRLGAGQLEEWARREARPTGLGWREFLAGAACSALGLHALIASAADPRTTRAQAERIDAAYLPMGAVLTLLDGLVDHERDIAAGELSYAGLYPTPSLAASAAVLTARRALDAAASLRHGPHHAMTLAGAVAYWGTAPGARTAVAAPAFDGLRRELGAMLVPARLLMRAWRAGRRLRAAAPDTDAGASHAPRSTARGEAAPSC